MTGAGTSYCESQWIWLQCTECGGQMTIGLLAVHLQKQHGKEAGGRRYWGTTAPVGEPHTYRMAFLIAR